MIIINIVVNARLYSEKMNGWNANIVDIFLSENECLSNPCPFGRCVDQAIGFACVWVRIEQLEIQSSIEKGSPCSYLVIYALQNFLNILGN